ncbi:hypothetical protein CAP35_02590 [Chitinophagaceae bacterium IBVUCB1]|nr:hypothetical protein CAP35_02590 [Chitinophagaceae bacterium IBVUCB1]
MEAKVKISIITPSYNRGYIIDETAQSIFSQTHDNWEWVIVDDGSTDDSWEKLRTYAAKDNRVKVYQRDREPKGACTCRNIAVEKCTGDFVMFLDTDDVLASFCLEQRALAAVADPDADFIIFPMLLFKNKPDDTKLLWNIDKDEDDLNRILKGDAICQGTGTLWKRQSFIDIGMWQEGLKLWQDVELHIRSLLWPVKYKKRMDLEPDVFLRISDDSLSRVGYYSAPKMESRVQVFTDICSKMESLGIVSKYAQSLRVMGLDILLGTLKSGYYAGAKKTVALFEKVLIFNNAETKRMKRLIMLSQYKLYKFRSLYHPIWQKVADLAPYNGSTLSQVDWQKEVRL